MERQDDDRLTAGRSDAGAEGVDPPVGAGTNVRQKPSDASLAALLDHLATSGIDVSADERLRRIYIGSDRDLEFRKTFDKGLGTLAARRKDGDRFEGRGIVMLAPSGAGKSECIERGLKRHPLLLENGLNKPGSRAISVKCLGSCTLKVLGGLLLDASGYDAEPGLRENIVWSMLRIRLKAFGILVVHVDEVNNLIENANDKDCIRIRNNFKSLINREDWPVALILSGTEVAGPVLKKDAQLRRRLDWLQLANLRSPDDHAMLSTHVDALCSAMEMEAPPKFETTIAPRLVHASSRQLGIAAELDIEAVKVALDEDAAQLAIDHYATAFARRTGCAHDQNPFVASAWSSTDPSIVLDILETDEPSGDEASGSRRRRRRSR